MSISALSRYFKNLVRIEHFYLDSIGLFHWLDMATRVPAAVIVSSAATDEFIHGSEACWLSQFWCHAVIHGDKAFAQRNFREHLHDGNFAFRLVPPLLHSKNPLESKHGVIRRIFLKLQTAEPGTDIALLALRWATISNHQYCNDAMSSFELATGFTKPVDSNCVSDMPEDIIGAHQLLQATYKLALMLKTTSTPEP